MLMGLILCTIGGCFLGKWGDVLFMWTISSCLYSLTLLGEGQIENAMFVDQVSGPIMSMSILVGALSMAAVSASGPSKWKLHLLSSSVSIVGIFLLTKSLILLFISFELTLIPMFLLIIWWGGNPERIVASKYMMLYTMVASAPLLFSILQAHSLGVKVCDLCSISSMGHAISFLSVFAFLVKAPMFLTHSWLPRAHVEAPLEGSMLLAGVMLKVGVYGFVRVMQILPQEESRWISSVLTPLALMGALYSMVSALSSDDLKVSVAYSSVAHMNLCLGSLCTLSQVGLGGSVVSMISHGMVSPILFYNVTLLYNFTHTRSVLLNKGVFGSFPQVKVLSFLIWGVNLGVPPFLSFLGEMKVLGSVVLTTPLGWFLSLLFVSVSSSFMVMNYGIMNHSGSKKVEKGSSNLLGFLLTSSVVVVISLTLFLSSYLLSMGEYT